MERFVKSGSGSPHDDPVQAPAVIGVHLDGGGGVPSDGGGMLSESMADGHGAGGSGDQVEIRWLQLPDCQLVAATGSL